LFKEDAVHDVAFKDKRADFRRSFIFFNLNLIKQKI